MYLYSMLKIYLIDLGIFIKQFMSLKQISNNLKIFINNFQIHKRIFLYQMNFKSLQIIR